MLTAVKLVDQWSALERRLPRDWESVALRLRTEQPDELQEAARILAPMEVGRTGAELTAVIQHGALDWLDAPIERVGAKFAPLPFAPGMEQWAVPHADDVLDAIRRTVART